MRPPVRGPFFRNIRKPTGSLRKTLPQSCPFGASDFRAADNFVDDRDANVQIRSWEVSTMWNARRPFIR
jgi:hypothetical protein